MLLNLMVKNFMQIPLSMLLLNWLNYYCVTMLLRVQKFYKFNF